MSTNPVALDRVALEGLPSFILPPTETREKLLAAAARASRLLLEAADAMQAMPEVLRVLGEAADVDRTALALAEIDAAGERWLVIKHEWIAEELRAMCDGECTEEDQYSDVHCTMLQAGKSIVYCKETMPQQEAESITSERAKSSAIVPILVDGDYVGVIGFDDWRRARKFDSSVVSALEIAAGLVGAALHRERLVETMRRERELAAEESIAQLHRANATLRANLLRLSRETDSADFIASTLIDATRQLDAAAAYAIGFDTANDCWKVFMFVEGGSVTAPPFQVTATEEQTHINEILKQFREPIFYPLEPLDRLTWPGVAEWHSREGHKSAYLLPLVFGENSMGFIGLVFRQGEALNAERTQLAMAFAHQATLSIGIKKLSMAAKTAAVLAERNRMGQEIHDGLAQGFTGILMQLGAAEEAMHDCARNSPLPSILTRIRDLAKEGLAEARRSVGALRPEQARRLGLEFALRQLAERSSVQGRVECAFEGGMQSAGLAPEHQHELLRIAQEAVSNALRHAHPTTVIIILTEEATCWSLAVRDNGRGMTLMPELYAQQGYGLANMRERAGAIGGKFEITSKPGEGTRVEVRLPRPVAA